MVVDFKIKRGVSTVSISKQKVEFIVSLQTCEGSGCLVLLQLSAQWNAIPAEHVKH